MAGFAEVRFKGTRKGYYSYAELDLRPGHHVIVQADRGEDLGEVTAVGVFAERKCAIIPVFLPGLDRAPKLPGLLEAFHAVDFRKQDPNPLEQLIWGITGRRPGEGKRG